MAWTRVLICPVMVLVLLACGSEISKAGERGITPPLQRLPDIPTERLERPRPEQDRLSREQQKAALRHAEAIGLAKTAAKKELGKSFDDHELKAVVFDPLTRIWSVTFDPKPPRRASEACLTIFVRDDTKDTNVGHCS